eukprot:6472001-Amphidinium_carterae.5
MRHEHRHGHWHGPAIVISQMRSKLWISCRGNLWLCAPEQLRAATPEESLAHKHVSDELLEMAQELSNRGVEFQESTRRHHTLDEPSTSARPLRPNPHWSPSFEAGRQNRLLAVGTGLGPRSRSSAMLFVQSDCQDDLILEGLEQCAHFSQMSCEETC